MAWPLPPQPIRIQLIKICLISLIFNLISLISTEKITTSDITIPGSEWCCCCSSISVIWIEGDPKACRKKESVMQRNSLMWAKCQKSYLYALFARCGVLSIHQLNGDSLALQHPSSIQIASIQKLECFCHTLHGTQLRDRRNFFSNFNFFTMSPMTDLSALRRKDFVIYAYESTPTTNRFNNWDNW